MTPDDWSDVRRIYEQGIATGDATFETAVPDWAAWDRSHLETCRLTARRDGAVAGWAAFTPFSARHVYRGVVEGSVYMDAAARGSGVGSALLRALIEQSEAAGIWTILAKVFPENEASLRLLDRHGFRRVGLFERIGHQNGVWRDVVLLERRTP